ncbi:TIGR00730 family Rossman fold protein [Streptomyces sp. NPDC058371]|uniref:LOG family protein n=1 Tax=Streptomyces sp. NPDC058371 TaxID=3346463 RepID=UPI0036488ECA
MVPDLTHHAVAARQLRVTVFCGAAPASAEYLRAATAMGRLLAEHQIHVLYGGGRLGLMGALADAALAAGGHVTGIIPQFLSSPDIVHSRLTVLQIVPDMATRKRRLIEAADAVLALPGGFGTLDELAYVWASAALGSRTWPVGLLNIRGYYTPLVNFVRTAADSGFLAHHDHLRLEDLLLADDDPARLLDTLASRTRLPTPTGIQRIPATARELR